ncbi:hypothetical protein TNCT_169621 [Trichonephila clavata]|uniref:Uncharacterized protein n=1 Tax=Trichonephila clavata TaxID=2740835 RepID=A0A8X6G766_TRICU|nr:hypothetical protein TNCT_169621 [Trichonephila clavata]
MEWPSTTLTGKRPGGRESNTPLSWGHTIRVVPNQVGIEALLCPCRMFAKVALEGGTQESVLFETPEAKGWRTGGDGAGTQGTSTEIEGAPALSVITGVAGRSGLGGAAVDNRGGDWLAARASSLLMKE